MDQRICIKFCVKNEIKCNKVFEMTSKLSFNHPSGGILARQAQSNVKVMLTVFFDFNGIVHHEFLPRGQTVNKEYYLQV